MWFPPLKLPAQVLPFVRIEAAPDAERLVGHDRVRQALAANRAHREMCRASMAGPSPGGKKSSGWVPTQSARAAHVRAVPDLVCASSCGESSVTVSGVVLWLGMAWLPCWPGRGALPSVEMYWYRCWSRYLN